MNILSYPSAAADKRLQKIIHRDIGFRKKDTDAVARIVADVRKNGDAALLTYARRFDCPEMTTADLAVTSEEFAEARKQVDRRVMNALSRAIRQITAFHRRQLPNSWVDTARDGSMLGQMIHPVDAAGVYVPGGQGGTTPLVSSVLMGVIPARIAGVPRVVMASPPMANGRLNPYLLVAAEKTGVDAVYKVGSAWAVAGLAYGTETLPRVDVIVGPGNLYVTLAKKLVAGTVGIDMIAGPSEILIIADNAANPEFLAADMLSQAEHDKLASAVLLTTSASVAENTRRALTAQLEALGRREIAAASIKNFAAILVVPDLNTAVDLANRIAPEHLELQVAAPLDWVGRIRNAGAVFMGEHTPEPIGDYIAGPNHVLPTAGTARFSSALSVETFVKKTSLIYYNRARFCEEAKDVMALAGVEGLGAHANAVAIRLK
ncbi:MAG: histidinol dehydrogenase [Pseudomonadota bacterium]